MVFPILMRLAIDLALNASTGGGGGGGGKAGGVTGSSFRWVSNTINPNMIAAAKAAPVFLARTTEYHSVRTEAYAKSKAPWRDRTGNARSGLTAQPSATVSATGGTYTIELYHRVPYGVWLETRHSGRYAIINDSISVEGAAFFNSATKLFAAMFGGS